MTFNDWFGRQCSAGKRHVDDRDACLESWNAAIRASATAAETTVTLVPLTGRHSSSDAALTAVNEHTNKIVERIRELEDKD